MVTGSGYGFDPNRKIVSVTRACEIASVSRRTLYHWMESGKVEWLQTAGGNRRVFADTLFREREEPPVLREHPPAVALDKFPKGPLVPPGVRPAIERRAEGERFRMGKMGHDEFLKELCK